jgi:hypothetical protein
MVVLLGMFACVRVLMPVTPPSSTAQCTFNSDCQDLMVCADGSCREECHTSRDCAQGTTCRPSTLRDTRVCLPPDAVALCVFDSDCAVTQSCGVDGRCRAQCAADADCTAGDHCVLPAGFCSRAAVVGDAGVLFETCDGGTCTLTNDHCEDALEVPLVNGVASLVAHPESWTDDIQSCSSAADGFFRFTLAQRSVVNLSALDDVDVRLGFLQGGCGQPSVECNNYQCETGYRAATAVLEPGEHRFVMDARANSRLRVFAVPIPEGVPVTALPTGTADLSLTLEGAAGGACGETGPTAAYWFVSCKNDRQINTCGAPPPVNVRLALVSPGSECYPAQTSCAAPEGDAGCASIRCPGGEFAQGFGVYFVSGATPQDTGTISLHLPGP